MRFFALILLFALFFTSTRKTFAVEVLFSLDSDIIQKDQEITLDVVISGAAKNTINYIRPAFSSISTPTSYFGFVLNHKDEWYNGASPIDPKKYLEVLINDEGKWSGQVKVKPDTENSGFKGNGKYLLKVGRYTASATSISKWSEPKEIEIQGYIPSVTPTTVQSFAQEKPIVLQKSIQFSPTPKNAIATASVLKTETQDLNQEAIEEDSTSRNQVLELIATVEVTPSIKKEKAEVKNPALRSFPLSSFFIISGSMILILGCGILLFRAYKRQKQEQI